MPCTNLGSPCPESQYALAGQALLCCCLHTVAVKALVPPVTLLCSCPAIVHREVLDACRLEALMFDEDAVRQLEATVAQERAAVQKCQERVDELNSQLAGGQRLHTTAWKANAASC